MPSSVSRLSALALELPRAITPTIAGLTVGAVVGVIGFVAVLVLVGRGNRRARRASLPADRVVFIPPYGTMPRNTPLPPRAFVAPSSGSVPVAAPYAYGQVPSPAYASPARAGAGTGAREAMFGAARAQAEGQAPARHVPQPGGAQGARLPFVPSSELSARVFAKMGYTVDGASHDNAGATSQLLVEVDMLEEAPPPSAPPPLPARRPVTVAPVAMVAPASGPPAAVAPASVAPALVAQASVVPASVARAALAPAPLPTGMAARSVESTAKLRAADKSAPHPLGVIKSSSAAMKAAPVEELAFDDSPTEIGETYFDQPPQPRPRRTDPPKIRAIAPAAARFPEPTPNLPRVTPPPMRAVQTPRG